MTQTTDYKIILDELHELEQSLELPKEFTWRMYKHNSDWTFVIAIHAFLETLITEVLSLQFDEATFKTIQKLPLNGRISKLGLLVDLNELPKEYTDFIKQLSTIRNKCAHNVRNFNISLVNYVADLKRDAQYEYLNDMRLAVSADDVVAPDYETYSKKDFIIKFPSETIFFGAIAWLRTLKRIREKQELLREIKTKDQARIESIEKLFQDIKQ